MNAGQLAALIAAGFFAVGVCVAAYALVKLARLLTVATGFLTGMREQTDVIIDQARAAIDRTNEQLDRTDAITANMNEVSANVAELTEHVSALAGLGRALTVGPVGKASAVAYGIRHALDLRRSDTKPALTATAAVPSDRSVPRIGPAGAVPGRRPAFQPDGGTTPVPAQRSASGIEAGTAALPAQRSASGIDAGTAALPGQRPAPGQRAGSAAVRQATAVLARRAQSAAARRAGHLAVRGAGVAGRSLAARAIGRAGR